MSLQYKVSWPLQCDKDGLRYEAIIPEINRVTTNVGGKVEALARVGE